MITKIGFWLCILAIAFMIAIPLTHTLNHKRPEPQPPETFSIPLTLLDGPSVVVINPNIIISCAVCEEASHSLCSIGASQGRTWPNGTPLVSSQAYGCSTGGGICSCLCSGAAAANLSTVQVCSWGWVTGEPL